MIKLFYHVRKQNELAKHDCNEKPREFDRYNKSKKYQNNNKQIIIVTVTLDILLFVFHFNLRRLTVIAAPVGIKAP